MLQYICNTFSDPKKLPWYAYFVWNESEYWDSFSVVVSSDQYFWICLFRVKTYMSSVWKQHFYHFTSLCKTLQWFHYYLQNKLYIPYLNFHILVLIYLCRLRTIILFNCISVFSNHNTCGHSHRAWKGECSSRISFMGLFVWRPTPPLGSPPQPVCYI